MDSSSFRINKLRLLIGTIGKSMSKLLLVSTVAAGLTLGAAAHADEMDGNFYAGASVIGVQASDTEFDTNRGTGTQREAEFDFGGGGQVRVGYDYGGWRAEVEAGLARMDIDSVSSATDGSGDIDYYSLMLNGYADIETDMPVTPYISAGVGGVGIDGDISYSDGNGTLQTKEFGGIAPAVQLGVGMAYGVTETVDVIGGYNITGVFTGTVEDEVEDTVLVHTVKLGLNVSF